MGESQNLVGLYPYPDSMPSQQRLLKEIPKHPFWRMFWRNTVIVIMEYIILYCPILADIYHESILILFRFFKEQIYNCFYPN